MQALQHMLLILPGKANDPPFRISRSNGLAPLTDSVPRRHLNSVSQSFMLSLNSPLDLRWLAATWAFHHGISMKDIMHHGTWKSDAMWGYI